MEHRDDEVDAVQLFRTIWRGKWLIGMLALGFGVLGYLYATKVAEPVYRASATVAIESSQPQVTDLDALVGGLSAEVPSLNTQMHLIRSRQLLQRLVLDQQLTNDPEFNPALKETNPYSISGIREAIFGPQAPRVYSQDELIRIAVDRLRDKLTVSNPSQSFVFQIGIAAATPEKATDLANALAMTYINDQLLFKEEQSAVAISFLDMRTLELQVELNEAELEVKDFAASIELIGPETLAAKNRQVKELRERLMTLDALVATQQVTLGRYNAFDVETATLADVEVLDNLRLTQTFNGIAEDATQRARFQSTFEIEAARVQASLDQAQLQRQSLATAVLGLEQEVENESRDLLVLQQLQREADAIGEIYGYFLARLKEAEVQQGTQQPDARLLSAAVLPRAASSPRVLLIMAVCILFGGIIGTGLVLLRELNKGGIRTATELQKRGQNPVLGQIPMAPIRRRNKLVPYLVAKDNTAFSESIRNLRTSVLLSDPVKEPQIILLTSSVPGEGKTTTSISMAHSLVGMGKSVLLVEGDLRKNTLGQYFEGTATKLADKFPTSEQDLDNAKVAIDDLGFDVLFGARAKLNAADFFASEKFKQFIKVARENYDHVIIDAPPILPVTDARIIGQHVDAILYAVAWDETRGEVVEAGMSEFTNAGLSLTGLILTKIDAKKARSYGGSTRYGSYYGEYSTGYYS